MDYLAASLHSVFFHHHQLHPQAHLGHFQLALAELEPTEAFEQLLGPFFLGGIMVVHKAWEGWWLLGDIPWDSLWNEVASILRWFGFFSSHLWTLWGFCWEGWEMFITICRDFWRFHSPRWDSTVGKPIDSFHGFRCLFASYIRLRKQNRELHKHERKCSEARKTQAKLSRDCQKTSKIKSFISLQRNWRGTLLWDWIVCQKMN